MPASLIVIRCMAASKKKKYTTDVIVACRVQTTVAAKQKNATKDFIATKLHLLVKVYLRTSFLLLYRKYETFKGSKVFEKYIRTQKDFKFLNL